MSETIKIIASTLATGIAVVAYIPYLIDMFRGKNKPHLYTWISIFLVTAIVAYIQVIGGSGVGAIPVILGVIVDAIILFYCFRFGTKDVVFMDKICLALSIIGVIAFAILKSSPIISLTIVSVAEVISFIPTVRKTRNDPYSESLTSYYFIMLKLLLVMLALQKYNLLTVSYSILWLVVFVLFISATYYWRSAQKKKLRHKGTTPSVII